MLLRFHKMVIISGQEDFLSSSWNIYKAVVSAIPCVPSIPYCLPNFRSFEEVARKRPWEFGRFCSDYEGLLPRSATRASHRVVLGKMWRKRSAETRSTFSTFFLNSDVLFRAVKYGRSQEYKSVKMLNDNLDAIRFMSENVHWQARSRFFSGSFKATPLADWYRGAVRMLADISRSGEFASMIIILIIQYEVSGSRSWECFECFESVWIV